MSRAKGADAAGGAPMWGTTRMSHVPKWAEGRHAKCPSGDIGGAFTFRVRGVLKCAGVCCVNLVSGAVGGAPCGSGSA
eukprot:4854943-Pyramimonas_sp.AAC.1